MFSFYKYTKCAVLFFAFITYLNGVEILPAQMSGVSTRVLHKLVQDKQAPGLVAAASNTLALRLGVLGQFRGAQKNLSPQVISPWCYIVPSAHPALPLDYREIINKEMHVRLTSAQESARINWEGFPKWPQLPVPLGSLEDYDVALNPKGSSGENINKVRQLIALHFYDWQINGSEESRILCTQLVGGIIIYANADDLLVMGSLGPIVLKGSALELKQIQLNFLHNSFEEGSDVAAYALGQQAEKAGDRENAQDFFRAAEEKGLTAQFLKELEG